VPPVNSNSASAERETSTTATRAAPSEPTSLRPDVPLPSVEQIALRNGVTPSTIRHWRRWWTLSAKWLSPSRREAMAKRLIKSGSLRQLRGALWLQSIKEERDEP